MIPKKISVTAVVLTNNEEENIQRCLQSLDWCGEVIVIDDNSTDRTLDHARGFGATIYKNKLDSDFATQRNYGLKQAQNPWVFFVDADECVPIALAKEISDVIAKTVYEGFTVKRRDFVFGRFLEHGETARVRLLRLGKKSAGTWKRSIHEVWEVSGNIGFLLNSLDHYPHKNLGDFLHKINWYSSLNAEYYKKRGVKASLFSIIVYPLAKFTNNYFFLIGFADGMPGLLHAMVMSMHSFLTRAKLYLRNNP